MSVCGCPYPHAAEFSVLHRITEPTDQTFLLSSLCGVHRVNQHSIVHKFSFQIPFPGFISACSVANRISPVIQLQLHIRAKAMALECLKGAIQRHHSLSVQATNTNVKAVMDHPPNPREGGHKDTFLILHTVTPCRAHKAAELHL